MGLAKGAGGFVGVDIYEEWEDVAAELDEREADVRALRGIETVEIVPLVMWDEPTTAVHGSEVAGLALSGGEGSEEGVKEALHGRRQSRSLGGPVGLIWCVAWRMRAAGTHKIKLPPFNGWHVAMQQQAVTGSSMQILQVQMLLDRFLYLQFLRMQSASHHTPTSHIHSSASWHYASAFLVMLIVATCSRQLSRLSKSGHEYAITLHLLKGVMCR